MFRFVSENLLIGGEKGHFFFVCVSLVRRAWAITYLSWHEGAWEQDFD